MAAARGASLMDNHIPGEGMPLGTHSTFALPAIAYAFLPSTAAHPLASASASAAEVLCLRLPSASDVPAAGLRDETCHHLLEEAGTDAEADECYRAHGDSCIAWGSR